MKRIVFFGCSLTFGQDSGTNISYSEFSPDKLFKYPPKKGMRDFYDPEKTYPAVVGENLGIEIENHGVCGSSNEHMIHLVYEWILHNDYGDPNEILLVLNTTTHERYATSVMDGYRKKAESQMISDRYSIIGCVDNKLTKERIAAHEIPLRLQDDMIKVKDMWMDEKDDYQMMRSIVPLWGIKYYAEKLGFRVMVFNMLLDHKQFNHQKWYDDRMFELFENQDESFLTRMVNKGMKDFNDKNAYFTGYSYHFTSDGYRIVAENVCEIISRRYEC